jgi:hypothetical protein
VEEYKQRKIKNSIGGGVHNERKNEGQRTRTKERKGEEQIKKGIHKNSKRARNKWLSSRM